jgi:signal recognition particle subunit SRP54
MGPLNSIVGMIPGMPKELKDAEIDDRELARIEAMIQSMTPTERAAPELIDGSRRLRIANGSGTAPSEVSQLIKQFREMQRMMKRFSAIPGFPGRRGGKKGGRKGKGGKTGGRVTARGTRPAGTPAPNLSLPPGFDPTQLPGLN